MLWFKSSKKDSLSVPTVANAKSIPYKKSIDKDSQILDKESFKTPSVENTSFNFCPDNARNLRYFFYMISRYVPPAKSAVWAWKNLCFTNSNINYIGGTDSQRKLAEKIHLSLSNRIFPLKSSKGDGFSKLASSWLINVFRYGRFSGNLVLDPNLTSINKWQFLDPFLVFFEKETFNAFYYDSKSSYYPLNPNSFYYYGLDSDENTPNGIALIESAHTLMQIANELFTDMRLSSSNAGTPRLHIKIEQPAIMENENQDSYVSRVNTYFDNTVSELSELSADDNIYTWADVSISTVGGGNAQGFVWRQNLQMVQEEIVTAFHLFPWLIGKQFGTTRNWVGAQFDVLLQMVIAIQSELASFLDWIDNTNLLLNGITDVKISRKFTLPRDISALETKKAEEIHLRNIKTKLEMKFIDDEIAKREAGYGK